jgi:uroporphyrinogen decarboxylase
MGLNGKDRIFKALQIQEPDVIPTMELMIDKKVQDAILPGSTYGDFIDYLDMDAVVVVDRTVEKFETLDESRGVVRDQWGTVRQFGKEATSHPIASAIASEKDLAHYQPPDPDMDFRYEVLKSLVKRFQGHRAVVASVTDVFTICQAIRGTEQYFIDYIENPSLVDRLNEIVLRYNVKYIRNCLEVGADVIVISGDYAANKEPMMSPKHFKRYIFPQLKAMVSEVKNRGSYCIKHTDGNIWKILDMIVESGIDGIHPLEPVAGMDIGEVKKKYGDRLCLMENIDCGYTLSWGTSEEVRKEVRECIQKAAPGGGHILASSNSIHSSVNPDNFLQMLKANKEYGRYPISV